MEQNIRTQVTTLLVQIRDGRREAGEELLDLVYQELRGLASALYARRDGPQLLQPTALVHEAWLKMVGHLDAIECRRHFFAVAARAMRQVLADSARDARRLKRGGSHRTVTLVETLHASPKDDEPAQSLDLVALDGALTRLAEMNARHARVVEFRLMGLMTMQEIADELGISRRTAQEDWTFARTWLRRELGAGRS